MSLYRGSAYVYGQLVTIWQDANQYRSRVMGQSEKCSSIMSVKRASFKGKDFEKVWLKAVAWAKDNPVATCQCPHCGGRGFVDKGD